MKKILLSMLAFVAMAVNAQDVAIALDSNLGLANGTDVTYLAQDGVTLTFDKGSSNNAPKYYTTGDAVRLYGGNTVTVSSSQTITSLTFTISGTNTFKAEATANVGDFDPETATWTGEANEVTITNGSGSGHARISSVTVTLEGEAEPTVTANVAEVYFWNYAYANPEYGTWYETNRQYITVTENNFEENIALNAVMKSSGKTNGSYLENSTRFTVSGTVFTSGQINVMCTSKKPGVYEDAIQLKNGSDVYLEIPVKMVIIGTSDDGTLGEEEVWPFNVADAYAIHSIMPAGGNYYTDPTHEWSMYDDGVRCYKGIVAEVKEISTQYGNATFYIKDADGDQKLQIYRAKGLNNEAITDDHVVAVGQEVVVVGELCDYNGTPEIKNGYLYSVTGVADAITNVESTQTTDAIYNIAGQRVNNNAKGILIINGKKVIR